MKERSKVFASLCRITIHDIYGKHWTAKLFAIDSLADNNFNVNHKDAQASKHFMCRSDPTSTASSLLQLAASASGSVARSKRKRFFAQAFLTGVLLFAVLCNQASGVNPIPTPAPISKYGVPTGTLTVTTVEAPLLQTRTGKQYNVSSYASYPVGVKFDPHGAVGVNRSFQQRYPSNIYGAIIPIPINSKFWPANSGINQTRTYGPFTPGDYAPVPESYGMETINLVFIDGLGVSHTLDTKQIYVYPASATAVLYLALPPTTALATTNSFQGDPPRVRVDLTNVYPSAKTWIVIYQGIYLPTNAPQSPAIPNTTNYAPSTDLANYTGISGSLYVDLGNLSLSSSTYTIQVYQQTPAYGLELVNNYATFSVNLAFHINTEVGTVK